MSTNLPPYPPDDSGQWPPRQPGDLTGRSTLSLLIRMRRMLDELVTLVDELERRHRDDEGGTA